ncbi:hypothetical protein [Micromonospora sp. NPDC001898]|uniref:hypothetical protein n=1 Tax=Micromonospora sp. NPDC001898 TaxID=3364221 RepID=UPI003677305E
MTGDHGATAPLTDQLGHAPLDTDHPEQAPAASPRTVVGGGEIDTRPWAARSRCR